MQAYQLFPIVIVVGVVLYSLTARKKLSARAGELYGGGFAAVLAALAPGQRPDEPAPICVIGTERKMISAKIFFIGLTSSRLALQLAGEPVQILDRAAVKLAMRAKTFADVGNMQTTYSTGWELVIEHAGGKHVLRVYEQASSGLPEHPASVRALAAALGAAAA